MKKKSKKLYLNLNKKLQNILPLFNFNPEWKHKVGSQKELENLRFAATQPFDYDMRQFAQTYTKEFFLFDHYKILDKFIDKKFFNTVVLYGCLCLIYSHLDTQDDRILASQVEFDLRDYIHNTLADFFNKKQKEQFYLLSAFDRAKLEEEIIVTLWSNFKHLKIIKYVPMQGQTFITFHPEFNKEIFKNAVLFTMYDLPLIEEPIDWQTTLNGVLINGGYHEIKKKFLLSKFRFVGHITLTSLFAETVINKLQKMSWMIDPNINNYLDQEFDYILKLLKINKRVEIDLKKDPFQDLSTYLFFKNFTSIFDKFYYSYCADFRGRIYPQCSWAYSPSASKIIRKSIRLTKKRAIKTEEGLNFLTMKLGLLAGIKENSNFLLLNATLTNMATIYDTHKKQETYQSNQIMQIFSDLKNKETDHLIQLDARCSVYQFISIIKNDPYLMEQTNLIGNGSEDGTSSSKFVASDLYLKILSICAANLPHMLMNVFMERDLIKSIIMPKGYGLTDYEAHNKLIEFLDKPENVLIVHEIHNFDEKTILSNLKEAYATSLNNKRGSLQDYNWQKRFSFCAWFYLYFKSIIKKEIPQIDEIFVYFLEINAPLSKFKYETEFIQFNNAYNKIDFYTAYKKKDNVSYKIGIRQLTDTLDEKKTAQSSLANCVHACDACAIHTVISKWPNKNENNLITIHDCGAMHPDDAPLYIELTHEGYVHVQDIVKKIPELALFHKNGTIKITSKNLLKISI